MNASNSYACSPYPTIDLSQAIVKTENANDRELQEIQTQVKSACHKYGCFHVQFDADILTQFLEDEIHETFDISGPDKESISSLIRFADESSVKQSIESLFQNDFLSACFDESDIASNKSTLHFQASDGTIQSDDCYARLHEATYRGRCAESGSVAKVDDVGSLASNRLGEPKQSWEMFRCQHKKQTPNPVEFQASNPQRLKVMQDYMHALHYIALLLFSPCILNVPDNTFACQRNQEAVSSMDLLRVFRYDALTSSIEQRDNLGSSPHTDWGSLTVVWQDSKGGLQMYDYEQECWNDVEIAPLKEGERVARFFIHVGDFTSLAMNADTIADKENNAGRTKCWPSPLHRVLCPLEENENNKEQQDRLANSRCSLVYFVYPPSGKSIENAEFSLFGHGPPHLSTDAEVNSNFPFSHYMLLEDQSVKVPSCGLDASSKEERARKVYCSIRRQAFDQVIREKWKQVQR